ncbi:hypothetical protein CBL_13246 [Carabus blaptoides fortunei]
MFGTIQLHSRRSQLPRLQDVVDTLKAAWPRNVNFSKCYSKNEKDIMAQSTYKKSSGFPSPVLMRRRLSVPETVMRKHSLNQQRSDSTDSVTTQFSSVSPFNQNNANTLWNHGSTTGSESNLLSRTFSKRDPDVMRKSTLLRRMWSREFTGSNNQSFNEETFQKKSSFPSKDSRTSPSRLVKKSPEHVNKHAVNRSSNSEISIKSDVAHVKNNWRPVPETNSCNSYTSDTISAGSSTSESNKFILETSSSDIKVISTCSTTNETYSNTSTTANSVTNMDDNSDSAYTNTQTFTCSSTKTSTTDNNNSVDLYESSLKQIPNMTDANIEQIEKHIQNTQVTLDLNSNENRIPDYSRNNQIESETTLVLPGIDKQFSEINVMNLNTSTWNITINHSPETIKTKYQNEKGHIQAEDNETESIQSTETTSKPKSFYLKCNEDVSSTYHSRIIKYMISNVGAGSSYTKPMDSPQLVVPRYSALPRSISMEVNASSVDSTDKESDTASLVDSLDDPNSPRQSATTPRIKHDDKPVRGDLSALLPDNSNNSNERSETKSQKGSAFYIPIIRDEIAENSKAVAEHLPERVRNKLRKRQQKIAWKKQYSKNKTEDQCLDSNSNRSDNVSREVVKKNCIESELRSWSSSGTVKKAKKEKTVLSLPSYKINSRGELTFNPNATAHIKRAIMQNKRYIGYRENSESNPHSVNIRHPIWRHNLHQKSPVLDQNVKELISEYTPMQFPEKTEENKHDIQSKEWECISKKQLQNQLYKNPSKSKIPVLVQNKVAEIPKQALCHAYHFSDDSKYNSKADQLIANILIDALNKTDMVEIDPRESVITLIHSPKLSVEKKPPNVSKQLYSRYRNKFEMIPEEKLSSLASSVEECAATTDVNVILDNETNTATVEQNAKKSLTDASSQTESTVAAVTGDMSHTVPSAYKGKAALALIKDEDFSTIPKGWITFYMLRKSPGSPGSSTDEGINPECLTSKSNVLNLEEKPENLELRHLRPVLIKRRCTNKENLIEQPILDNVTQDNDKVVWGESEMKKVHSPENNNDSVIVSQKEHYNSSSETFHTKSPSSSQEANLSLPIALPLRQSKRQSYRRGRYKTSSQNQGSNTSQMPGVWSVTVSGTNSCGQLAPDLEMRLKFPCPQPTSQSDSGLGEEQPRQPRRHFQHQQTDSTFHLPPAKPTSTKKFTVLTKKQTDDQTNESINSRPFQYLPDLIKNRNIRTVKRRDVSVPVKPNIQQENTMNSMPPLKTRMWTTGGQQPRQTLTSFRRFSLHHRNHLSSHIKTLLPSPLSAATINNRQIIELSECFPTKLAVTGSAISPENKPTVPRSTRKDLTRNHFNIRQHHA